MGQCYQALKEERAPFCNKLFQRRDTGKATHSPDGELKAGLHGEVTAQHIHDQSRDGKTNDQQPKVNSICVRVHAQTYES